MPERHSGEHSVLYVPNPFDQHPQFAVLAANVTANWAIVEADMMTLYALLMGAYLERLPGFEPPTHPVAYQVFNTLQSFRPRLELLSRLIEWRAQPHEAAHFKQSLRSDLEGRSKERDRVAHGMWGTCARCADVMILRQTYGGDFAYRAHDLQQSNDRMLRLHSDLGAFTRTIYQRFRLPNGAVQQDLPT